MQDIDLIDRVAAQDNLAFETLMPAFRAWVRHFAGTWRGVVGYEPEDWEQIAWMGLADAARVYQPDRATFAVWAQRVMQRRVLDAVRQARRHKSQPLACSEPLQNVQGEEWRILRSAPSVAETVVNREWWRDRLSTLHQQLTPLERRVLGCLVNDCGPTDSARCLGVSYRTVDNALQRIRKKARRLWTAD